ncbi:MAG: hypothetical protein QM775_02060 [Pirellulales bacterium]
MRAGRTYLSRVADGFGFMSSSATADFTAAGAGVSEAEAAGFVAEAVALGDAEADAVAEVDDFGKLATSAEPPPAEPVLGERAGRSAVGVVAGL